MFRNFRKSDSISRVKVRWLHTLYIFSLRQKSLKKKPVNYHYQINYNQDIGSNSLFNRSVCSTNCQTDRESVFYARYEIILSWRVFFFPQTSNIHNPSRWIVRWREREKKEGRETRSWCSTAAKESTMCGQRAQINVSPPITGDWQHRDRDKAPTPLLSPPRRHLLPPADFINRFETPPTRRHFSTRLVSPDDGASLEERMNCSRKRTSSGILREGFFI